MSAIILANKSGDAIGKLPPSTCKQDHPDARDLHRPGAGISGVVFQTYPNQKALYAAYTAKVTALNTNKFKQNFNDCGSQDTFGEVGWNHLFQHTRSFTVNQMIMGSVQDDQAAGRVFCNYTQGLEYMVWTQNDGHLMGYVAGAGAHRRVELVGGGAPQHRHRRLADEHEHADPLRERQRRVGLDEPVPVHERNVRVPVRDEACDRSAAARPGDAASSASQQDIFFAR